MCLAHRLQRAIRPALNLDVMVNLLTQSEKLVVHFKRSCLAAEAVESKQVTIQHISQLELSFQGKVLVCECNLISIKMHFENKSGRLVINFCFSALRSMSLSFFFFFLKGR